jgi:predicted phosphodiesterase
LADPEAIKSVLKFKERFKPDLVAHLGDFVDMSAFRAGARGTADESEPIEPDFDAGIKFLKQLRPQIVLCGNHEDRLWRMQAHHSAIISDLAERIVRDIRRECDAMKARLIPYDYKAHYLLADFRLMHGTFYNENACRDHAEAYGNCIIAHTHKAGLARGRRVDNPLCVCVGTLSNVPNMDYAKNRRATLAWSNGLCFGMFDDKRCYPWLAEKSQDDKGEWVFPL